MIKNLAIGGGYNKTMLVLALVLGVLSAVLIGVYLSSQGGSGGGTSGTQAPVVVASQDIPAGTKITDGMVSVKTISQAAVLPNVYRDVKTVVGQVTTVALVPGEQVIPSKISNTQTAIAAFGTNIPLSLLVPSGLRAFAVAVNPLGAVGGLARAGDFVDVIASGITPEAATGGGTFQPVAACYLAQDVQVLAVSEGVKSTPGDADANSLAANKIDTSATTLSLAVTPEQAWHLAAAQLSVKQGDIDRRLWVALRPFGEHSQSSDLPTCTVTPGSLLGK